MSELELVRREYESSLSWRVTRPLRALSRRARHARRAPGPLAPCPLDLWLDAFHGDLLRRLDAACEGAGPEAFARFRELDADLWALLLTKEYTRYPHLRALLPDVPDPALQRLWNGASGVELAAQSVAFYAKLLARHARHGGGDLAEARVLDFGCGWGRLTRMLARDVAPGRLFGCDPVEQILDVCRQSRVPATLARSDFAPAALPFEETFDLAFAFSVFTHVSERAHERCLQALHAGLRPGALLVVTVRPPAYLQLSELMHPVVATLGSDPAARLEEPRYLFVPHAAEATHPQHGGGEMTYGETVVTPAYVRERWSRWFELVDVDLLAGDLYQVVLTLRRSETADPRAAQSTI